MADQTPQKSIPLEAKSPFELRVNQSRDVPEDIAAELLPADDRDAIVVARGTVKAVYAPARDEAVVTV